MYIYTYFESIKESYSMKVKKDNDFYNIDFIDSQLEISDINNNLQNHLIKFDLQSEDDNPKIQIIADVNTYSILIFIEKGLELHIDKDFQRIFGHSYGILRNTIQRSDLTPNVNELNYIKIFLNIVDNKTEENYLSKVFVKSSVGRLNSFNENSIYKQKPILNANFDYIEVTFINEKNEEISFKYFLQHFIIY